MKKAIITILILGGFVASFTIGEIFAVKNATIGINPKTYKSELTTRFLDGFHRFKYNGIYENMDY